MTLPPLSRRLLLGASAAAAVTPAFAQDAARPAMMMPPLLGPAEQDGPFWSQVQALYDVDRSLINLENGYWGIMARPVLNDYLAISERINRENTLYARTRFGADAEAVRQRLAAVAKVEPAEIALTRGATEALQILISGYNRLKPGDRVLYADLDYDSMQYAFDWLKDRRGVEVVKIAIPEPATRQIVLDTYAQAIEKNPGLKLILLTHLSHRTGLVMPVKEIADIARAKGIDVIVDAAHSWGQIDFNPADLGADFVGFNLHKWIGGPVGIGFIYIRKGRLGDIDRHFGDMDWPADDIRSRVHTGTANFAATLALPSALGLHEQVTAAAKQARLTMLRNLWVSRVRGLDAIEILTPDEAGMHAGITSFRIKGKGGKDDVNGQVKLLREKYGIMTVRRAGVAAGQCIRISPALYTRESDVLALAAALQAEYGRKA